MQLSEFPPSASISVVDPLSIKETAFVAAYMRDGNAAKAYRESFDTSGMQPATVKRTAFDVLHKPTVAKAIADLRRVAADVLAGDVGAMALRCYELATASPADAMEVVSHACRVCASADGVHPAWAGIEEFTDACEAFAASLDSPKPLKRPDARGGMAHDPMADPNPSCKACKGRGETTLHVRPTSEWSDAARALFDGAVVDDEGRVQKLLFQDRSKYAHMLHQLIGAYAPTKVEGRHAHLHVHRQVPDTRAPMSVDEAMAALEHNP